MTKYLIDVNTATGQITGSLYVPPVAVPPVDPPPVNPPPTSGPWEPPARFVRVPTDTPVPVVARATLAAPGVGASVLDPAFGGLTQKRVTQVGGNVYSQLQAFSALEDAIITIEGGVGYKVYAYPSMTPIAAVNAKLGSAPRWYKDKIVQIAPRVNDADLATLQTIDKLGNTANIWTSTPGLRYAHPNETEEAISENGWTIVFVHGPSGSKLIAVNLDTKQVGAQIDMSTLPGATYTPPGGATQVVVPNWIAPSPLGKYLVMAWTPNGTGRSHGIELFDILTGAFVRQAFKNGQTHGDQGATTDGKEFYLTVADSTSNPMLAFYDGATPQKLLRTMTDGSFGHVSCKGPRGWALFSGYDRLGVRSDWPAFGGENELYLIRLEGPKAGEAVRLCHHRSVDRVPEMLGGYYEEPKGTLSKSGKLMAHTDNFLTKQPGWLMVSELV